MIAGLLLAAAALPLSGVRLSARVSDASGAPVAGARVIVGEVGHATLMCSGPENLFVATPGIPDDQRSRYAAELRSGKDGRVSVAGLVAGEYTLIAASAAGFALVPAKLREESGPALELVLEPAARVEVSIAGLAYDPRRDVLELLPLESMGNVLLAPRLEQETGGWSFRSVALPPVRSWKILCTETVMQQDYRAVLLEWPLVTEPGKLSRVECKLDAGLEVRGRVSGPDGEPLADVSVLLRELSDQPRAIGGITRPDGSFRIRGLSAGRWRCDARRWKLRELAGCGNGLEELHATAEVTLPSPDGAPLELRVADLRRRLEVGAPAPDFATTTLDGRPLRLSELRGKIVLIDFWATWCGMCRVEMPHLARTYSELGGGRDFEIVGVSLDTDAELVRRFVASRALRWPQAAPRPAEENAIASLYTVSSTPETVLLDRDGRIAALHLIGEPLRKKIDELLANR